MVNDKLLMVNVLDLYEKKDIFANQNINVKQ
jgi:hypothetical protein